MDLCLGCSICRVQGLKFMGQCLGLRVRVLGLGFKVRFRLMNLGFWGSGLNVVLALIPV